MVVHADIDLAEGGSIVAAVDSDKCSTRGAELKEEHSPVESLLVSDHRQSGHTTEVDGVVGDQRNGFS